MQDAPVALGSREDFIAALGDLRAQGALDARDESDLIRQFDETLDEFQRVRGDLVAEYERRAAEQGREAADGWLGEAAQALGREQGTRLARLFATLPALTASAG